MKKITVRQQVMRFADKHPEGFTAAQAREAIKVTAKRLYVVLWQMKKAGVLTHDEAAHTYALTGVNKKKVAPEVPPPMVPMPEPQKPIVIKDTKEVSSLRFQVSQLKKYNEEVEERYNDALAIVRYLEDKLFRAIQHDARRGSNT